MVLNLAGSVGIQLILKNQKFSTGITKVKSQLDSVNVKAQELSNEFFRMTNILNGFVSILKIAGATLIGTLVGALAFSPQFKTFLSRLAVPFRELGRFIGEKLRPSFDKIVEVVTILFDKFQKFANETKIFERINTVVKKIGDAIINFDFGEAFKKAKAFFNIFKDIGKQIIGSIDFEKIKEGFNLTIDIINTLINNIINFGNTLSPIGDKLLDIFTRIGDIIKRYIVDPLISIGGIFGEFFENLIFRGNGENNTGSGGFNIFNIRSLGSFDLF